MLLAGLIRNLRSARARARDGNFQSFENVPNAPALNRQRGELTTMHAWSESRDVDVPGRETCHR